MASVPEVTLHLECWRDELSPAQKASYEKAEKEHNEIRNKLKDIVQQTGGKNIFSGQVFTAYQVLGPVPGLDLISKPVTALTRKKPLPVIQSALAPRVVMGASPSPEPAANQSRRRKGRSDTVVNEDPEPVVDIASDDVDEDYVPLSKRMAKAKEKEKEKEKTIVAKKSREEKVKTPDPKSKSPKSIASPSGKVAAISVRPTEFNSIGGLQVGADKDKKRTIPEPTAVVDLTKDEAGKQSADSREISFSKIQGKTFPSLVVLARPSLRVADKAVTDRPQLDAKVKNVLVHPAPKFTEWLIQQGLIKSEQTCQIHNDKPLKLGMYSDTSKFPYSGGYFWISECCPTRFTSVFHGSLFEGSPHPPSVILKLIYHWACQTNVSNVVNWVKVDNVYLKNLYTLLRSVCTLALCRHMNLLGGPKRAIEIGVISLGTTTQDGQQRQVKVEVLGVLDPEAKILRLRAVEPLLDAEKSYKKRFSKILEPLSDWVHKDSIILTDLTVDKGTLNAMGYKTVIQVPSSEQTPKNSNANVMDYLRRIVPRMFQNTLSLLSRQIIQQFLNELVWREMYGNSPGTTFDNIVKHLSEEAKIETKEGLITRLHKAAADPFKQWDIVSDIPAVARAPAKRGRKPKDYSTTIATTNIAASSQNVLAKASADPPKKIILKKVQIEEQRTMAATAAAAAAAAAAATTTGSGYKKTKRKQEPKEETVLLEDYYYGFAGGSELNESAAPCPNFEVPCPECPQLTFRCNLQLLDHLLEHVSPTSASEDTVLCRFCSKHVPQAEQEQHKLLAHPQETKSSKWNSCLVCQERFSTAPVLAAHMQKSHSPLEMPYRCAGCDFRSSILPTTIEHFYAQHKGTVLLQCPFCLKMACAFRVSGQAANIETESPNEPLVKNVKLFLDHLRMHSNKRISKPCSKCVLCFFTKGEHKFHRLVCHGPYKGVGAVSKVTHSETTIQKPPKKVATKETTWYRVISRFDKLVLAMENGNICLECGNDFDQFNHMIGLVQCTLCKFQTTCLPSMINHTLRCYANAAALHGRPSSDLQQEMHCKCGFSSYDGFALARHLLVCCSSDAVYTTVEAAQANVTERSMLDMLGLVRRDEDEDAAIATDGNEAAPETADETCLLPASIDHAENVCEKDSNREADEGVNSPTALNEPGASKSGGGVAYDPTQSLYNIAGTGEQQFTTQLCFDDLGPPSVLPAQDNDRTPQLKDDYQSLATPRVPDQPDY